MDWRNKLPNRFLGMKWVLVLEKKQEAWKWIKLMAAEFLAAR